MCAEFYVLTFNLNFTCKNLSTTCLPICFNKPPACLTCCPSIHRQAYYHHLFHAFVACCCSVGYRCNTNQRRRVYVCMCLFIYSFTRQALNPYNRRSFTLYVPFIAIKSSCYTHSSKRNPQALLNDILAHTLLHIHTYASVLLTCRWNTFRQHACAA